MIVAKLDAVKCDVCGAVVEKAQATERLTRYKGANGPQGERVEDLCNSCAIEDTAGVELKPWPRMKSESTADE